MAKGGVRVKIYRKSKTFVLRCASRRKGDVHTTIVDPVDEEPQEKFAKFASVLNAQVRSQWEHMSCSVPPRVLLRGVHQVEPNNNQKPSVGIERERRGAKAQMDYTFMPGGGETCNEPRAQVVRLADAGAGDGASRTADLRRKTGEHRERVSSFPGLKRGQFEDQQ